MKDLIKIAVALALASSIAGNLPQIIQTIRLAQIKLILDSQASKWPKAMTLKHK